MQGNVLLVVGDTTFNPSTKHLLVGGVQVANGVNADLSSLSSNSQTGNNYRSLSTFGGGSEIVAAPTQGTAYFYGGSGADTLVGRSDDIDDFYLKATPKLIGGSNSTVNNTDSIYGTGNNVDINSDNVHDVSSFFVSPGISLDLSNYNPMNPASAIRSGVRLAPAYGNSGGAASNLTGTALDDYITANTGGGTLTGGMGVDYLYGTLQGGAAVTFAFHAGDTGITSKATIDTVASFVTGQDQVQIDGITSDPSTYAEAAITSGSYADAETTATSLMADGTKDVVFVAGGKGNDGYLFWNADANHSAPDQAVTLLGGSTLSFFDSTDIASSGNAAQAKTETMSGETDFTRALFDAYYESQTGSDDAATFRHPASSPAAELAAHQDTFGPSKRI